MDNYGMSRNVDYMRSTIATMRKEIDSLEQDVYKVGSNYASNLLQGRIGFLKDKIAEFRNYAEVWASNEEMETMFGK